MSLRLVKCEALIEVLFFHRVFWKLPTAARLNGIFYYNSSSTTMSVSFSTTANMTR